MTTPRRTAADLGMREALTEHARLDHEVGAQLISPLDALERRSELLHHDWDIAQKRAGELKGIWHDSLVVVTPEEYTSAQVDAHENWHAAEVQAARLLASYIRTCQVYLTMREMEIGS